MISHSKNFIFIHIPKTAGSSVTNILLPYSRGLEKVATYWPSRHVISAVNILFNLQPHGNRWFCGIHKHASALENRSYLGNKKYQEYFSFAFVRNPWDWLVSDYSYNYGDVAIEKSSGETPSFQSYVQKKILDASPSQYDLISDANGKLMVDYVGRFESLSYDFDRIAAEIGLKNAYLPHLNASSRKRDYREYYTEKLRTAVGKHLYRDVENFGYEF